MRNQLLVLLLVFGLSHAADGGRAHAEDGDDFLFGDLGKIGRPLTEAERSFLEGAKKHKIPLKTLRADANGIEIRHPNGLFAGVDALFAAKAHCEKQGKLLDEDNAGSSQVSGGEIVERFNCLSPDEPESIRSLRATAQQGNADAQYELGRRYRKGDGVEKNPQQAVEWFRLAASQGHANAQNLLGVMYSDGRGIGKDLARAAEMFRLAAKQHHAAAQLSLGVSYEQGLGVPVDYPRALMWYRFSKYEGADKLYDRLRRKMNDEEDRLSHDLTIQCLTTGMRDCN